MCMEPATASLVIGGVSAAVSAATSAMQISQSNQQAKALAESATSAAATDYSIMDRRSQEVDQKAAVEMMERQRQGLKERGKLMVAIGESGVGGNSPLREIENSMLQTDYDVGIIQHTRESEAAQIQDEKQGIFAQAQGRINQARSQYVNPMTGMLKIGADTLGAGLAGYGMGKQLFPGSGSSSTWKFTGGAANRALANAGGVH